MPRPPSTNPALTPEILNRMLEKGSLRAALRDPPDPTWPSINTFLRWVLADPDIAKQYAEAREVLWARWADEIVDIADDSKHDLIHDENGKVKADWEVVNRSRLRVDTRKWLLSKLKPGEYGDKIKIDQVTEVVFRLVDETPQWPQLEATDVEFIEAPDDEG